MLNFLRRGSMKGEKPSGGFDISAGTIARIVIRFFQFIMGIVVIGLYAQDLDNARRHHKYVDSKWVYATFAGALGSIAAIVLTLPWVKGWFFFIIDWFVWFVYLVLFGIFGKMYISEDPEGSKGIIRMKHAVWVDLVNFFLWLITAIWGTWTFFKARNARTLHTGRAPDNASV